MGTEPIAFGVHLDVRGVCLELHVRITAEALLVALGDAGAALPRDAVADIDLQLLLDDADHGLLAASDSLGRVLQKEACRILGESASVSDAGPSGQPVDE